MIDQGRLVQVLSTEAPRGDVGERRRSVDLAENAVPSNRDKKQHPEERGLDSKHVETEQRQDHAANRQPELRKEARDPGTA